MSPLTFAIGDVHGCLDMLQGLLGACEAHAAGRPARYVFLGDYIDRGPDSRGVIQLLMRRQQAQPGTSVCLRGNHEQMAIMAHESELALPLWL
ncbi:MAG: metallophosphoesterase, partial [Rhodoplanes sp.]